MAAERAALDYRERGEDDRDARLARRGRSGEVWSVVAYLAALKDGAAPAVPARDLQGAAYCASCHGTVAGPVPRLDIQDPDYLAAQLDAYRSGQRPSGIMAQALSLVPPGEGKALLAELADQPQPASGPRPIASDHAAQLARRGTRDVPACIACHGEDASKGPALFGQNQAYLAGQLKLWKDGVYDHDPLMRAATRDLSQADIAALSRYFAGGQD